jgi:hypothetical protein
MHPAARVPVGARAAAANRARLAVARWAPLPPVAAATSARLAVARRAPLPPVAAATSVRPGAGAGVG